ncbi:MAG TPA: putative toxin-antitoxin system toxin component, PIN family [Bryobacteraceae bacterium]|nr:putative toxin-antitoxin system toxin component, PIN family [Bryobacteraceae bacterium]
MLDTNVVVSALLSPAGFEDRVLKLVVRGQVQLYVSPPVLAEYERVLTNSKFSFSKLRVQSVLSRLRAASHTVHPVRGLSGCRHDDDNRFLECADAAGAGFLITGNQRHFPARWKQTQIVNARQFLEQTVSIRR